MPAILSKELVLGAAFGAGVTGLAFIGYRFISSRGKSTTADTCVTEKDVPIDARMKHNWLLNTLDGLITDDSLESLKQISKTYLEPKTVAKIKTMNDLLSHLEVKCVITVGQYDKLIEIMENARIGIGIEDIKSTAISIQKSIQNSITSQEQGETSSLDARSIQSHQADCYDALIMYNESAETMVHEYRQHLETDLEVEDVRVELIGHIGIGQSHLSMMEDIFDKYRYIFIFLTPNFTQDTLTHFKMQMAVMQSLQDQHKQGRIIPIWTAKEKEKTKNYPSELVMLNGVHYWRFHDDNYKTNYIKLMRRLIEKGRNSFQ
ncbi:hypothetical protein ACJMK2_024436 [Sinanodonta woodiana]|uniref:TIR domain-containing protein n=1 Tax=Sinanodonta woodiana TaxID=1069815 RepID=A0ABD3XH40_SINWO